MLVDMPILDYLLCWSRCTSSSDGMFFSTKWADRRCYCYCISVSVVLCGGTVVSHFYMTQSLVVNVAVINSSFYFPINFLPGQNIKFVIMNP